MTQTQGAPTILSDMSDTIERSLSTVLVTHVQVLPATQAFEHTGQTAGPEIVHRCNQMASGTVAKHAGQLIRTTGGSIMAEFADPVSAVRAGMEIARATLEFHRELAPETLELRIGIHGCARSGEGIDVFGDVVHVAAGIAKHAAPSQIVISRPVYEALPAESDVHCQWLSKVALGGRIEEVELFEVCSAVAPSGIPSRYEVLAHLGTGGMGIVYKVRDVETGEIVALKILKPEIACDPAMQENLRREVRLARKVTHRNVCRIHEFNRSNGTACISMEFVEGESLLSKLRCAGRLGLDESLDIARQICAGLREAHAQGIVHRDLKTANIMVDRNGVVKITDFGIARPFQGNTQMTGTIAGTPAYMAPEQVELGSVSPRTDIYALGLLLYEMVAGTPAFAGDSPIAIALKQIRELPKRPREIVPALPIQTEAVIWKCLQKDPAKRFQAVEELEAALNSKAKVSSGLFRRASVAPALRVSGAEAHRKARSMAQSFFQTITPAIGRAIATLARAGREVALSASSSAKAATGFLRQQNWQAMLRTRKGQAAVVAMGMGVALILSGTIAFALGRIHAIGSVSSNLETPAELPSPGSSSTLRAAPAPQRSLPVTSERVDLSGRAVIASANQPASGSPMDIPASVAAVASPAKKARPTDRGPAPLATARQKPALSSATPQPAAETAAAASAPRSAAPANEEGASAADPDLSAAVSANEPPSVSPAPVIDTPAAGDAKADATAHYLEVGSFKDAAWADSAVDKLTQLGFHAVSVRKAHLWLQSYRVQVGPYAGPKDLDAARESLAQQGFKSHPVK